MSKFSPDEDEIFTDLEELYKHFFAFVPILLF